MEGTKNKKINWWIIIVFIAASLLNTRFSEKTGRPVANESIINAATVFRTTTNPDCLAFTFLKAWEKEFVTFYGFNNSLDLDYVVYWEPENGKLCGSEPNSPDWETWKERYLKVRELFNLK